MTEQISPTDEARSRRNRWVAASLFGFFAITSGIVTAYLVFR